MRVTRRAGAQRRTAEPLTRLACGGYRGGFGVGVATALHATVLARIHDPDPSIDGSRDPLASGFQCSHQRPSGGRAPRRRPRRLAGRRGALPGQTRRPGGPGRRADHPGARRRPRSRPGSPIQCRGPGGRARHVPPPASRTGQKHLRGSLLTGHRAARSSTSSAHWFRLLPDSSAASAAWRCTSGLTRNIIRPE